MTTPTLTPAPAPIPCNFTRDVAHDFRNGVCARCGTTNLAVTGDAPIREGGAVMTTRTVDTSPALTPAPAPMTAGRLEQIREWQPTLGSEVMRVTIGELMAHIDALTARVAELEQDKTARQSWARTELERLANVAVAANDRTQKLEAELAAARKVEDGEVRKAIQDLLRPEYASSRRNEIAILLTRLSAALKEAKADTYRLAEELVSRNDTIDRLNAQCKAAEAKLESARPPEDGELYKKIQDVLDSHSAWIARPSNDVTKATAIVAGIWGSRYADAAEARAQAAEAKLEMARRDALEAAAKIVEGTSLAANYVPFDRGTGAVLSYLHTRDFRIATAIRALQTKDTTP